MTHPPNIPLTPQTDERNFPRHDPAAPVGRSGHPYPKQLTREFLPEDVKPWQRANVRYDRHGNPPEYWDRRCPQPRRVLPSGKVIPGELVPVLATSDLVDEGLAEAPGEIVECKSAEDEARVRQILGLDPLPSKKKPESISVMVQPDDEAAAAAAENVALAETTLQKLVRQNSELEKELERHAKMRVELEAKQKAKPKRHGGWPKGRTRKQAAPANSLADVTDEGE